MLGGSFIAAVVEEGTDDNDDVIVQNRAQIDKK